MKEMLRLLAEMQALIEAYEKVDAKTQNRIAK